MEIQILSKYYFWYILVTAIGLAVGILSYRSTFPPLSRFRKILISALRAAMIILLGVFLIEPLINLYSTQTIEPGLAVLVDVSGSMGIKDGDAARIDQVAEALRSQLPNIDGDYRIFTFATDLNEAEDLPAADAAGGDATSISAALEELGRRGDLDRFGAVLVASDGRQNLGDDPLDAAGRLNLPVYTLTVGERVTEKNLSIDNIIYPAVAFSGDTFRVEAEISAIGLERGRSRLALRLGGSMVSDQAFDIPAENRRVRVGFDVIAPEPGDYEYTASAPILEGEAVRVDNERPFTVRVLKDKLRLLLLSSMLDWEYKFTLQVLGRFEEFRVDAVYPEIGGRFAEPGIPKGFDGLKAYDAVIVINSSPQKLRLAAADLKKYVEDGGSLIYMAGSDAVNDIRLFEGILPVKPVSPRINFSEYFFEPSPARRQHAAIIMNEDPNENARIWRSLPPFTGLLTGIESTGDVLLEAGASGRDSLALGRRQDDQSAEVMPVLIVGSVGRGHAAALTGFPWWRSYFGSVSNARLSASIPDFWRNLIRWSVSEDESKAFRVITGRKVYRLGEPVSMTGYLFDESNRPRNGALVDLTINAQGDPTAVKDVVLPQVDNGIYSDQVTSLPPGGYEFRATAAAYGDTLGRAEGAFTIEAFSLEMASSTPDYNLTRRLAEGTGGRAYIIETISSFPKDLRLEPYSRENQATIRPFGMPIFLVILIVGLCAEWALRKRFRLP
jgi:hypothetical protein